MDLFVARQPIFDRNMRVVAYELLFRSGMENFFNHGNADEASSRVIDGGLLGFGLDRLTAGKKAFFNFTRRVLVKGVYALLPPDRVVVELLEEIEADPDVLAVCDDLKHRGFTLALDDFVFHQNYLPLLEIADIIKIDFRQTPAKERRKLSRMLDSYDTELLAEKVETRREFAEAKKLGYSLFQGYFFSKPEIISKKEIPGFKLNYLRFVQEVNRPDVDFDRLEEIIQRELSLSVKLLRYLNSAWFGWKYEVESIKQAIRLLGEKQIKKWATLVALTGLGDDKPAELVVMSLVRARFCEQLGAAAGLKQRELELFLLGLLSLLDALVDRPLEEALAEMSLSDDIRKALVGEESPLSGVYALVKAYERGEWSFMGSLAGLLGIRDDVLAELYSASVEWADTALGSGAVGCRAAA